jgi:hypothetical protein
MDGWILDLVDGGCEESVRFSVSMTHKTRDFKIEVSVCRALILTFTR